MSNIQQVKIFDTTLRDGQQCPGAGMTFEQNLEYARLSAAAGVDILEAGFPAASQVDFDIVREITLELSSQSHSPIIAGLTQMREEQVIKTIEALEPGAKHQRAKMHIYVPVDPKLMKVSLGELAENYQLLIENTRTFCKMATDSGLFVEFSPEGYSRQGENFNFVTDLIRAAVEGGADTINCPDTIGGASRFQGEEYFVYKMNRHAEIIQAEYPDKEIVWSTHCHNDLGLAVENSITAVFEGPATQIEGCFNGVGERAGNASLEQCIMIIETLGANINGKSYRTGINTPELQAVSDYVHKHMLPRQPHTPVTGKNAARHSSGGHTNAIIKDPLSYQPFDPSLVGQEVSLAFGPLSGGNHAKQIIERHGYVCTDDEKAGIAQFVKELYADRRKGITDEELMKAYFKYRSPIQVQELDYERHSGSSSFTLIGAFFDKSGNITNSYQGPDSALAALKQEVDKCYPGLKLETYSNEAETADVTSFSKAIVVISRPDRKMYTGVARDHDIIRSSMLALIAAVNRAYIAEHFSLQKEELVHA